MTVSQITGFSLNAVAGFDECEEQRQDGQSETNSQRYPKGEIHFVVSCDQLVCDMHILQCRCRDVRIQKPKPVLDLRK